MKITLDDILTALYLTGLDSKCATPRDFLLMQNKVSMDIAESKLQSFKDFHDTTSNKNTYQKETPKAFPAIHNPTPSVECRYAHVKSS